jgi:hypothetical protein
MAADRTRVLKRVTELLNLCDQTAYTTTLSPMTRTRHETAIADFVDEAAMEIMQAIAERPNEFRYQFLSDTSAITTSGDRVPNHLGKPAAVKILTYNGKVGDLVDGHQLDYRKIQSYRERPDLYDPNGIAHNLQGSALGGYYDIWNDRFFFTGYSATLSLARRPVRADVSGGLIPDILESVWVNLGVGKGAKVGEALDPVISAYGNRGLDELTAFKAGTRQFAEVSDPKPAVEAAP